MPIRTFKAAARAANAQEADAPEVVTRDLVDVMIFLQRGDHHTRSDKGDQKLHILQGYLDNHFSDESVRSLLIDLYYMATNKRNAGSHYCQAVAQKMAPLGFIPHSSQLPRMYRKGNQVLKAIPA